MRIVKCDVDIEAMNRACLNYARRVCPKDPALDAEDVLQMAWLRAWAHLVTLPDDEARRKYLNVTIRTVAIDYQRRMNRRPVSVQLHDTHISGDAEDEAEPSAVGPPTWRLRRRRARTP